MIITYYGKESFKIQLGDLIVAFNPISKESDGKPARFGADIGLVTLNHPDFNGTENLSYGEKEPFLITGPGEYEVKEIFIKGFLTKTEYDGDEKINTIYYMIIDGMNICFLGALDTPEITGEAREAMTDVDILFVPIGNKDVLDPTKAHKVSRSLGAKIIIPMHYKDAKSPELKKFLEETSSEDVKPIDKLTIKKKDLEGKQGDVVVLKSS